MKKHSHLLSSFKILNLTKDKAKLTAIVPLTMLELHDYLIAKPEQDHSETSEQDEASFECQRREPLGGSGSIPPTPKKFEI